MFIFTGPKTRNLFSISLSVLTGAALKDMRGLNFFTSGFLVAGIVFNDTSLRFTYASRIHSVFLALRGSRHGWHHGTSSRRRSLHTREILVLTWPDKIMYVRFLFHVVQIVDYSLSKESFNLSFKEFGNSVPAFNQGSADFRCSGYFANISKLNGP